MRPSTLRFHATDTSATMYSYFMRSRSLAFTLYMLGGLSAACCQPAWYNQPQFFRGTGAANDPIIALVPFTGETWGSQFSVYPYPTGAGYLQQDVATWKARNGI